MVDMKTRRARARERIERLEDEARQKGLDPKAYVASILEIGDDGDDMPMPRRKLYPPSGGIH
jgi:hypothetical protein